VIIHVIKAKPLGPKIAPDHASRMASNSYCPRPSSWEPKTRLASRSRLLVQLLHGRRTELPLAGISRVRRSSTAARYDAKPYSLRTIILTLTNTDFL